MSHSNLSPEIKKKYQNKKAIQGIVKAIIKSCFLTIFSYNLLLLFRQLKKIITHTILSALSYLLKMTKFLDEIPFSSDSYYYFWLLKNHPRKADFQLMSETAICFKNKPVISVILESHKPQITYFKATIESIINQIYSHWELYISNKILIDPEIKSFLQEYSQKDSRIKIIDYSNNESIVTFLNRVSKIAIGEFITFLDDDDLLSPDALYQVAITLNKHPMADMIYSDEDNISEKNLLKNPFFKTDWCPDSFLSRMYTGNLAVYRRELINKIGGFRMNFEGAKYYDLVLRLTEKTNQIYHIPKIIYHSRTYSTSILKSIHNKNHDPSVAKKALAEAIKRRGESGKVMPTIANNYIVRYEIKNHKLVSIIIPTKNLGKILDCCLDSIFTKTDYPNYEVVLIDNNSTENYALEIIQKWQNKEPKRLNVHGYDSPFNYSKINNYAVQFAQGDYLLFLNNDIEIITEDWITAMVEQAQRPSIGAVGALLLYPDNTIQHAGVIIGLTGLADHCYKHFSKASNQHFNQIQTINNYSAVTAACLMCRTTVFQKVGGFEEQLSIAFNDVDLCLKFLESGYRNVYLPQVQLYHYESKTRGFENTFEKQNILNKEIEYIKNKWNKYIDHDPCYSPHLTRKYQDFRIKIDS
ncbi:MAG TPA: glycosyl transferase family 2 [Cyanothece sp. UBA12306]|nr:glycosyl transferase family 2 [Cyanothece sp. UBA12306]